MAVLTGTSTGRQYEIGSQVRNSRGETLTVTERGFQKADGSISGGSHSERTYTDQFQRSGQSTGTPNRGARRSTDIARPRGRVRSPQPSRSPDIARPLPAPAPLRPQTGLSNRPSTINPTSVRPNPGFSTRTPAGPVQPYRKTTTGFAGTVQLPSGVRPGNIPQVQTQFQLLDNQGTQGTPVRVNPVQNSLMTNYRSVLAPSTQRMPAPQPRGGTYTIKAGDTLSSIASQLGTTVSALKAMNPNIKDVNKIYAGNQINFGSNVSGYAESPSNSAIRAIENTAGSTDLNDYFANIRSAESGGDDSAKNPNSSATGRYQFTKGTWKNLIKQYPDSGLTEDGRLDPDQQEVAIRLFTAQNEEVLQNAGIEVTNGTRYAAHFLGAGSAKNVLRQDDDTMMADVVSDDVIKANPFLKNMDVGEFKKWANRHGGA